jgi:hypothetical protein
MLLKHAAQYFRASPSCYRFAVTNSVVHAGWNKAAHSKCCFGLSASHFRLPYHLKPISTVSHAQSWPSNSPDENPCAYFLSGILKENIFPKMQQTIMKVRALIIQACKEITEDMFRRVINITVRAEEVARRNGGHTEHLIHTG